MTHRIGVILLALGLLGGCGMKGALEPAAPIFGADRDKFEAERAAAEAAAAEGALPAERQRMEIPVTPAPATPAAPPEEADKKPE
jgi:hypothetical protein